MSFTDDDLKRLKLDHMHRLQPYLKNECETCNLLARLEAAEDLINAPDVSVMGHPLWYAWRVSAGKKEDEG